MSFPPTVCPRFAFKMLLYASECPHACIFLLLDLFPEGPSISSASCPQSLQVHLHGQWHTKEFCLRRYPGRRAKHRDQIDYVCHNPSRGQGIFLFSQPLVLSPGRPATSASGYQVYDPGDKASAFLTWKTLDLQQTDPPSWSHAQLRLYKKTYWETSGTHTRTESRNSPSQLCQRQAMTSVKSLHLTVLTVGHPSPQWHKASWLGRSSVIAGLCTSEFSNEQMAVNAH